MRDPVFKTQMFRFVDVLPTLTSPDDVVKHMLEYLKMLRRLSLPLSAAP